MNKKTFSCWNCGTIMTPDALSKNDGDCPECGAEIDLDLEPEVRAMIDEQQSRDEIVTELEERCTQWRNLALQFDRHRMQAMALLRLAASGEATKEQLDGFIKDVPTPGAEIAEELSTNQCTFLREAERRLNAVLGYSPEFDDLLATVNTACIRIRRLEDNEQLIEALQKAAIHVKPTCGQLYEELNAVLKEHKAEV